jgi:hypothetical protein
MSDPTPEERLNNLESGIVSAAEKMHDIITDAEVDDAMAEIRLRLNALHKKLKTQLEMAEIGNSVICSPEE